MWGLPLLLGHNLHLFQQERGFPLPNGKDSRSDTMAAPRDHSPLWSPSAMGSDDGLSFVTSVIQGVA